MEADNKGRVVPSAGDAAGAPIDRVPDPESTTDEDRRWSPTAEPTPRHWGHLQVLEKVGEGAFGQVYRAWDPKLERTVALKLLRAGDAGKSDLDSPAVQEARLLARVRHPNIVTVYGVDRHTGRLGLWMEFVRGRTVQAIVREQGPLGAREAALIVIDVCRALAAVHALGLVHRDIKAQNVMREQGGRIVLMDFGVGQESDGDTSRAEEEALCGTPLYMAPEVLLGQKATAKSDAYSVGVLLYHLVTGAFPVEGRSALELRRAHEQGNVKLLRDRRPDLPESFIQTAERALAPRPADRFNTAGQMIQALNASLGMEVPELSPEPLPSEPPRRRRTWASIGVVAALFVLAAVAALGPWWPWSDSQERESVMVAEFENRTSEPLFDTTIRELLSLAFEQSRRFRVLPRSRVLETLELMKLARTSKVDAAVAAQICRRESVSTLISGQIASAGSGYEILVRAADPANDSLRAVVRQTFQDKQELTQVLDRLAAELRKALGERQGRIARDSKPLARVTTPSLDALMRFSRALEFHDQGKLEEAIQWLKSAVEKDPDFAMAYRQLANYHYGIGRLEEALAWAAQAYKRRERTSERERHLIEGYYHMLRGDFPKAAESYRMVTALYPQDATAHYQLAQLYNQSGDLTAAVELLKRAVELSPNSVFHRALLAAVLAEANREEEALRTIQMARARSLQGTQLYWGEGLARLGEGEFDRAREAFHAMTLGGGVYESWGHLYQAQTLILEGKLREAASRLDADVWAHLKNQNQDAGTRAQAWLAWLYLLEGDRARSRAQLGALEAQEPTPSNVSGPRYAVLILAALGEHAAAERIVLRLEDLAARFPNVYTQGVSAHARGELERAAGRPDAALSHLERARTLWGDALTLWSLAQCSEGRQDYGRALALYEDVVARKGSLLRWEFSALWPMAHLQAARCRARLGQSREAVRHYDAFLQNWGSHASESALVRQAQKERHSLTERRSGG